MRPEAKTQIIRQMKTYQQIKSHECEASLINLNELSEKENSEAADRKVNCKEKVGFVDWSCDKTFYNGWGYIFVT